MKRAFLAATMACISVGGMARADVRLPALFSDHMVLQRDLPLSVWGWADVGEEVTVSIAGQTATTKANTTGRWMVKLDRLVAGEGLTLTVSSKNCLALQDVLVGDVWLCSGQSNMGVPLGRSLGGEAEAATADCPSIRFFTVPSKGSLEPQDDVPGAKWEVCSPRVAAWSSAVAYFFGHELQRELKIPIGLINSSVGGSTIESWLRAEALATVPEIKTAVDARLRLMRSQPSDAEQYPLLRQQWEARYGMRPPDNQGLAQGWSDPAFDDADWKTVAMPANWADAAGVHSGGVFWLRKEVLLPSQAAGNSFSLILNSMHEQYDTTYFNGQEVGHTGDRPPLWDCGQRRYDVPGRLVKAGRNVIALRIVSASPCRPAATRSLWRLQPAGRSENGGKSLAAEDREPLPAAAAGGDRQPASVNQAIYSTTPTMLDHAMIRPLVPVGLRGVVWYQGESNTSNPAAYDKLFPLLISDWRRQWGQGDFPFYFVQLPNYLPRPQDANQRSRWAEIREAEAQTLAKVPNTGMAVTIDVGEGDNIHPINKRDVGHRLALAALAQTYERRVESVGPTYESMAIEADRIRIHFAYAAGLTARNGAAKWFAIAGKDRQFAWAEAAVDGSDVVVSSPQVSHPIAARYAWADNPEGCNLYNAAGLPAVPFGPTIGHRRSETSSGAVQSTCAFRYMSEHNRNPTPLPARMELFTRPARLIGLIPSNDGIHFGKEPP